MNRRFLQSLPCLLALLALAFALHHAASLRAAEPKPQEPAKKGLSAELMPRYGTIGPRREPTAIPGETFSIAVYVSGFAVNAEGKPDYAVTFNLFDSDGNTKCEPRTLAVNDKRPLGGNADALTFSVQLARDMPEGDYQAVFQIEDHASGTNTSRTMPVKMLPKSTLGVYNLKYSHDGEGKTDASGNATVGEAPFVVGVLSGLSKHVRMKAVLSIYDKSDKAHALIELVAGHDQDYGAVEDVLVPMNFNFPINRPGEFIVELKVTDLSTNKTATYEMPLTALMPPGPKPESDNPESYAYKMAR